MPTKVSLSVYLVLERDNKILLGQRQNTGYEDGNWMFIAGHVEPEEAPTDALCREVFEEIGITILPEDLEVLYIMHRISNRENIDIFMRPKQWEGEPQNKEPNKCSALEFFDKDKLPNNMVGYNKRVLENIEHGKFYSEYALEKIS